MSSPVTLTSTYGLNPPTVKMTSPLSGTQRSVELVGRPARGRAISVYEANGFLGTTSTIGLIGGVELLSRGSGYVAPPRIQFIGSGSGATASATIVTDPANGGLVKFRKSRWIILEAVISLKLKSNSLEV